MSSDDQQAEQLRTGIASALGRLRGDVVPLPVAYNSVQPNPVHGDAADSTPAWAPEAPRADPDMKIAASIGRGGIPGGMLGDSPPEGEQADLLSGLEPPLLMPPMTEEERVDRHRKKRNHRLMGLVTAATLVAMAAVGYWTLGGNRPGEVPLITADQSPEKVKPEDEGGLQIPNQDIAVLEDADGATPGAVEETILPAPEQPVAAEELVPEPPLVPESATEVVDSTEAAVDMAPEAAPETDDLAVTAPAVPQAPEIPEPDSEAVSSVDAPSLAVTEIAAPEAPATPQVTAPTEANTAVATGAPTDLALAEPVVEPMVQPVPGGKVRIQLAALKTEDAARAQWSNLQSAHAALLGQLELTVEPVDKGADGILYRIQAGPLADREAAKELCAELKKQKQDCIVAR